MKLAHLFPRFRNQVGFTMIELLVVIAVIGVLAVAVLSSINPIEQINKGRDTRTRSDAAQLINAVDRYYALQEKYPWNVAGDDFTPDDVEPSSEFVMGAVTGTGATASVDTAAGEWNWIDLLVSTAEVKQGFTNRLKADDNILVFKTEGNNSTMYACFLPTSNGFKQEAMDNCADGTTPGGTGNPEVMPTGTTIVTCEDETEITAANLICLP
jgi:prepilin-type N-terminal cleavage/methylation domain-containing protein